MEKEFVVVNKKNVGLRIILFLIAVGIAIGCFAYGCSTMNKKEPGYYSLDGKNGNEEYFIKDTYCYYYLDGKSDSINSKLITLNALFKDSLIEAYQLVDPSYHEDYIYQGIGKVNHCLNEDITISEEAYNILKDAYTKTLENKNFNMFSGILFDYWDSIFMSSSPKDIDPSIDNSTNKYIEDIISYTNNLSNFNLQFKDDFVVNFSISSELENYLNNNPVLSTNIINLNNLEDAYRLDIIYKNFIKKNYLEGYIYTDSGYGITLSNNLNLSFNQIDYVNNSIINVGTIKGNDITCYCEFNRFKTYDEEEFDRYYKINDILRNPHLDLSTGLQNQLIKRMAIYSTNIIDSTYLNIQINALKTKDELDAFILALDSKYHYVYTLNNETNTIHMDDTLKDSLILYETVEYEIKK